MTGILEKMLKTTNNQPTNHTTIYNILYIEVVLSKKSLKLGFFSEKLTYFPLCMKWKENFVFSPKNGVNN